MTGFLIVVLSPDVQTNKDAINGASHWGVIVVNEANGQIQMVIENAIDTSSKGSIFEGFRYGHMSKTRQAPFNFVNLPIPLSGVYAVNGHNGESVSHASPAHSGPGRAVFYWTTTGDCPTAEWLETFHANFDPTSGQNNPCGRSMAAFYNAWYNVGSSIPAVPTQTAFTDDAYNAVRTTLLANNNCV